MQYDQVLPYTALFIAEQADFINEQEVIDANRKDMAERETYRAWRQILRGHSNIRAQIGKVRRALHDMGAGLSVCGNDYIRALYAEGYTWHDPHPDQTLLQANKDLLSCIADMPRRWSELYEAELREKCSVK